MKNLRIGVDRVVFVMYIQNILNTEKAQRKGRMKDKNLEKFIDSWGMMGTVWGENASIARVHALLIANEEKLSLDEIARSLGISRGNASMCLKELRSWGVVRLIKEAGNRQDYYVTEPDMWRIFIDIVKERKRREFDPTLKVVRETIKNMDKSTGEMVKFRLREMEKLLMTLNMLGEIFLADEDKARSILAFASKFSKEKKKKG